MTHFVVPHNDAWKAAFDDLAACLSRMLDGFRVDIQHVGSTAIPGLAAKPILDIDIIIGNKADLTGIAATLEKAGYQNRGEQGIPGRFAFRQTSALTPVTGNNKQWQEHHLYICFSDSLALKNHVLFRDALLNNTQLTRKYQELKMTLAKQKGMTRENYTRQKTEFIISVLGSLGLDKNALTEIENANK